MCDRESRRAMRAPTGLTHPVMFSGCSRFRELTMKSVGVDALIDPNRNIAMRSQDNVGSCLFKFPHPPSFLGRLYIMVRLPLAIARF